MLGRLQSTPHQVYGCSVRNTWSGYALPCAGGRVEGWGALQRVLVHLGAAQRRLRAPCHGMGTGAAAQRDCKQCGPGWTVSLLLLCFHYRTKGQKVFHLLTL